jgi:cellulose synthase/poly-beta-1,6-N-acetylglucosamine synthase-like glycosyltransferase
VSGWVTDAVLAFNTFILGYFLALNSTYLFLFLLSLREVVSYAKRILPSDFQRILKSEMTLPVSILVPARDEEKTIVETVRSLLRVSYPELEVIVVSDGSTDATVARLVEAFGLSRLDQACRARLPAASIQAVYGSLARGNLTVVDKARGGKADALNAGINFARYPLFCSFDADSIIEDDALLRAVKPFLESPGETVACGGIVRVANGCEVRDGRVTRVEVPRELLPRVQVVEYLREFLIGRVSWSVVKSVMIVSGAFGLYRKAAVVEVGGYHATTDTEDLELIVRLHKRFAEEGRKYRIVFLPDPICWTEVPSTFSGLMRQRNRWHRGLIQTLFLHGKMLCHPRFGAVGLAAFPFFVLFEMLGPLVEFSGYCVVLVSLFLGLLDARFFLLFVTVAILYGVLLSVAAVLLDELSFRRYPGWRNLAKMLVAAFLEHILYRQLVMLFKVKAFWDVAVGRRVWGREKRRGFRSSIGRAAQPDAAA